MNASKTVVLCIVVAIMTVSVMGLLPLVVLFGVVRACNVISGLCLLAAAVLGFIWLLASWSD